MFVKLDSLVDSKMKVFDVSQVLKQGINIQTVCPNYILEFTNTKLHLLQVYICTWVKINVIENHVR